MDEYIKKQDLVDWCNETYNKQTNIKGKEYVNAFLQAVIICPTADVVPKSEVEKSQAEKDALIKNYAECMKDYAREIFDEIESIIRKHDERPKYQLMLDLSKLKKKYIGEET